MSYPFPTAADEELFSRFGIEPRSYTEEQLDSASQAWDALRISGLTPSLFVSLIAVCEGSLAEATVLWDGLRLHFQDGLKQFQERSGRYYIARYSTTFLSERSCQRAFTDLADAGLIILWPRSRTIGQKFRVDWVELSLRLQGLKDSQLPGLDGIGGNDA